MNLFFPEAICLIFSASFFMSDFLGCGQEWR